MNMHGFSIRYNVRFDIISRFQDSVAALIIRMREGLNMLLTPNEGRNAG